MVCILYVIALTACLGLLGWTVERLLPAGRPRRAVWCATLALSFIIPPLYRSQHMAVVGAGSQAATPSWWVRVGSYDPLVMRLWAIASLLLLVWALLSVLRASWLIRRAQSASHAPRVIDGVAVALTESLGPATVGLWHARVVVPRWVLGLPQTHREYVLRHEDEHRRAHDTDLLFFTSLLVVLTPWNLPLYWQLRRLRQAIEMDCDNRVVKALGDASRYGALLLDIADATSRGPRLQPGFLGSSGSLERRLRELVAPGKLSRVQRYLLPVVALALLIAVVSTPHPMTSQQAHVHHRAAAAP